MTDKELGEAILKGLDTCEESIYFYYSGPPYAHKACALGLGVVGAFGIEELAEIIESADCRAYGATLARISDKLDIDRGLASSISQDHFDEKYTAREIAENLIAGTYIYRNRR